MMTASQRCRATAGAASCGRGVAEDPPPTAWSAAGGDDTGLRRRRGSSTATVTPSRGVVERDTDMQFYDYI